MDAQLPLMYHHVRPYYIHTYPPAELKQTTEVPAISKCSNHYVIDFIPLNHCLEKFIKIVFFGSGKYGVRDIYLNKSIWSAQTLPIW